MLAVKSVGEGEQASCSPDNAILLAVEVLLAPDRHADAGDDEHRAEDIEYPVKPRDERRAKTDE